MYAQGTMEISPIGINSFSFYIRIIKEANSSIGSTEKEIASNY
jgi:hypothetical protein